MGCTFIHSVSGWEFECVILTVRGTPKCHDASQQNSPRDSSACLVFYDAHSRPFLNMICLKMNTIQLETPGGNHCCVVLLQLLWPI